MSDLSSFVPSELDSKDVYHLLTSLVVPRPIGWISTVDAAGVPNLAPYSYFNVCANEPPVVFFSSGYRPGESGTPSSRVKDSVSNALEVGEFVVNVVGRHLLDPMVATSADLPSDRDEFAHVGLEAATSLRVRPPRVAGARAALECRVHSDVRIGTSQLVFGEVVMILIDDRVIQDGRVDFLALEPVGRLGGSAYAPLTETVIRRRPGEA